MAWSDNGRQVRLKCVRVSWHRTGVQQAAGIQFSCCRRITVKPARHLSGDQLLLLLLPQVTLLANGRLMYHGVRDGMVDWFGNLGYVHDALEHGVASDWALDLVAVGFAKPPQYFGHTMRSKDDLAAASQAFLDHYMRVGGHMCDDQGWSHV